jgi:hypothetical protein
VKLLQHDRRCRLTANPRAAAVQSSYPAGWVPAGTPTAALHWPAQALGLDPPISLLARADEVIE